MTKDIKQIPVSFIMDQFNQSRNEVFMRLYPLEAIKMLNKQKAYDAQKELGRMQLKNILGQSNLTKED